jgi:hypothetical protein
MASYTDEQLLAAVQRQISTDRKFRREVEEAVNSRWTVRLRKLIADVAELFFGRVVGPSSILSLGGF